MPFSSVLKSAFLALMLSVTAVHAPQAQDPSEVTPSITVDEKDMFKYLDNSILWYRHVSAATVSNVSSREMLLRTSLQQSALKSLRYSFDYARIQAAQAEKIKDAAKTQEKEQTENGTASEEKPADGKEETFDPKKAKIAIDAKIAALQKEVAAANAAITRTPFRLRADATAKRDKLVAELNLAKTQEELIQSVLAMTVTEEGETAVDQIDNLAKAIPELAQTKKKPNETAAGTKLDATAPASGASGANAAIGLLLPGISLPQAETGEKEEQESKGFVGLLSEFITRARQKEDVDGLRDETKAMQAANEEKIKEQRDRLIEIIERSRELSAQQEGMSAEDLTAQGKELDVLNAEFKYVSSTIVPLSKQRMSLKTAAQTIENWIGLFNDEIAQIVKRLIGRLISLAIAIAVPFVFSEIARRAVTQYGRDARRRRQLNIIRRVILGIVVGLIILLSLVSEFGSMATFIGFVTAGITVALQNVILSIAAYFFFFGRFGIKVGSRVTVQGVTGDVIETGFVRLYLMELTDEKGQYRPTGRIVAFPNSIMFQPTAFFKQVPGVNYRWHEMVYPLAADTTRVQAEAKLKEALDSVYKDSKDMIDMQKAAMEQSTRLRVKEPRPDGKIERTPDGLNFVIRYPVDVEQAEKTDKTVMQQVQEIFERSPAIKRLNDDPPSIKRK